MKDAALNATATSNIGGAIGVFDSGVGGLTVFRELKKQLPQTQLIYLGDTARTPYGAKGPETIKRYACECASFLIARGISQLVIACNTASSHALTEVQSLFPLIPVFGTIAPAVDAAISAVGKEGAILVLGTRSTVRSGAFQKALEQKTDRRILQQACPLFVPLVEESILEGRIVEDVIAMYLGTYKNSVNISTVILGCTHYPLLRDALQRFFGSEVTLVDCAASLAGAVASARAINQSSECADEFFVTDDPDAFSALASRILLLVHPTSAKISAKIVSDLNSFSLIYPNLP